MALAQKLFWLQFINNENKDQSNYTSCLTKNGQSLKISCNCLKKKKKAYWFKNILKIQLKPLRNR